MTVTHDFIRKTELNPKLKIKDLNLSYEQEDFYGEYLNIKKAIRTLKLDLRIVYAMEDARNGDLENSKLEFWLLTEKNLQIMWNLFLDTLR